jgi:hypothetical protein
MKNCDTVLKLNGCWTALSIEVITVREAMSKDSTELSWRLSIMLRIQSVC